jgi:ribosomal protein L31
VKTEIAIDGTQFRINGQLTHEGKSYNGRPIEGLLFNSRMIQALFDDECPETRERWRYPDTDVWDADRNTDEFCAALPEYRRHGMLAATVGLQGGGSIYTPDVYGHYINSAFTPEGDLKSAYFERLTRILKAADELGMVVIVNFFYFKQVTRIDEDKTVVRCAEKAADWLLWSGYRNILIDVANESHPFWKRPLLEPENIHRLIDAVKAVSRDGRRLLVSASSAGREWVTHEKWLDAEDFSLPHGNGCDPGMLRTKLRDLRATSQYKKRPRPILINEDSVAVENLEAAVEEGASWGFYCQGYGSGYKDRWIDWSERPRESKYEELSGFQTVPVNWSINTPVKRAFFDRLKEITAGE